MSCLVSQNQAPFIIIVFDTFESVDYKSNLNQQSLYNKDKMKITVKTLKGEIMDIEVQPSTTILQIKQKIKELKGFELESQKIVFKGKATHNEDNIEKLNIKDKDFLVVMATVKKPQSKKQQNKKLEQPKQQKTQQKKQTKNQTKPDKNQTENKQEDPQFEKKVTQLLGMGFSREKCVQALRAAFGNTQRAVEYLLNGIPANLGAQQHQGGGSSNPLSGMLGGAQFEQLRQILRTDPSAVQPILEQLAQTSPQLYNLITQHPEQFERMILQESEDGQYEQVQQSMEPQGDQIVVTQAQQQAIERLAFLGFDKIEAAQAYLACDKNEEMAANLLFDRLAKGDIQQGAFQEDFQDEDGDDDNLFN